MSKVCRTILFGLLLVLFSLSSISADDDERNLPFPDLGLESLLESSLLGSVLQSKYLQSPTEIYESDSEIKIFKQLPLTVKIEDLKLEWQDTILSIFYTNTHEKGADNQRFTFMEEVKLPAAVSFDSILANVDENFVLEIIIPKSPSTFRNIPISSNNQAVPSARNTAPNTGFALQCKVCSWLSNEIVRLQKEVKFLPSRPCEVLSGEAKDICISIVQDMMEKFGQLVPTEDDLLNFCPTKFPDCTGEPETDDEPHHGVNGGYNDDDDDDDDHKANKENNKKWDFNLNFPLVLWLAFGTCGSMMLFVSLYILSLTCFKDEEETQEETTDFTPLLEDEKVSEKDCKLAEETKNQEIQEATKNEDVSPAFSAVFPPAFPPMYPGLQPGFPPTQFPPLNSGQPAFYFVPSYVQPPASSGI